MKLTRREFILSSLLFTTLNSNKMQSEYKDMQDAIFSTSTKIVQNSKKIIPKALKAGSKIAITAPASPTSPGEIQSTVKFFKKNACTIELGKTIRNYVTKNRYFSAPDEERASEFMSFASRDDIDCIICGRGGYGVMRILNMLDYNIIAKHPKIIMGFSDITALINAISQRSNLVTYHGPVATVNINNTSSENIKKLLFSKDKYKPINIPIPNLQVLNTGICEGEIVGGNLSIIASTIGTDFEIDTKDKILFLEEVSEQAYKIDKMLTQLSLAGKLNDIKGVAFGYIKNLDTKRNFFPGLQFTVRQVIENRFKPLGIPIALNLPFGHNDNNMILPIGIKCKLDLKQKSLTFLENTVDYT